MCWLKVLVLISVLTSTFVFCEEDGLHEPDTSNWVDPGNMFDYDTGSKTMRKSTDEDPSKSEKEMSHCPCEQEAVCGQCNEDLASVSSAIKECKQELKDAKQFQHIPTDFWFFKQFISQLVKYFGSPWGSEEDLYYQMSIQLTREDLELLSGFSQGQKVRVQEAHAVLSQMVQQVDQVNLSNNPSLRLSWREEAAHWALISLQLASTLKVSWQLFVRLIVITLLFTIPWTWWHLYLEEIAKRHAAVMKDVPVACMDTEVSWFGWVSSLYTIRTDECFAYQRSLLVDPMWDVPPTKAVAVTLTRFLVEPLEHIGLGFKRFMMAMVTDVPVMLYLPFLIFSMLLILLSLVFLSGYRVDIFYLFSIAPGTASAQGHTIEQLQKENDSLRIDLEAERQQTSKVPSVASAGVQSLGVMEAENILSLTENVETLPENEKENLAENVIPQTKNVNPQTENVNPQNKNVNHFVENLSPLSNPDSSVSEDTETVHSTQEGVSHITEHGDCVPEEDVNLGLRQRTTNPETLTASQ